MCICVYDLALTDILMPAMDGYVFTRKLRAQGETLPIVGVTAAVLGNETDRLLIEGANQCISKPLTAEKVKKNIGELRETHLLTCE